MCKNIRIDELDIYKTSSRKQKAKVDKLPYKIYDFTKLKDENIREKLEKFVKDRCVRLSIVTVTYDILYFNVLCDFFNNYKFVFQKTKRNLIMDKYKEFLMGIGKPLFIFHRRNDRERNSNDKSPYVRFMDLFLDSVYEVDKKNLLFVEELENIRVNPVKPIKQFNFGKIIQSEIKEQIIAAIRIQSSYKAAETLRIEILEVNRLSKFLYEKYSEVISLKELNRNHIEEYITYIKTESGLISASYNSGIAELKSIITEVGKLYDWKHLETLFLFGEYRKKENRVQRYYSIYEIRRFNSFLVKEEGQFARCILLHQLIGSRISDTLLLETNCLSEVNGKCVIVIRQQKTKKSFIKPINNDVKKLIEKSIEHTLERYGKTRYIFVSDRNPDRPISYSNIEYKIKRMIRINHIKDDKGEILWYGTHVFRRCYGKSLAEMHYDDVTISKLLGHSSTKSVHQYRKMSSKQMAKETEKFREHMNNLIIESSKDW